MLGDFQLQVTETVETGLVRGVGRERERIWIM